MNTSPAAASPGKVSPDRGRRTLVLLLLLTAAPAIVAYALYFSGWRPGMTSAQGDLITPARPLPEFNFGTNVLMGKWTYVHIAAVPCVSACLESMAATHAARHAQKFDWQGRVQRVWLQIGPESSVPEPALLAADSELIVLRGTVQPALTRFFQPPAGGTYDEAGRVFLIDPLGNLMMTYPAGADVQGMQRDLKRLLKVSRIG